MDVEVPKISDSAEEVSRLAKVWDNQGLLVVHNHNMDRQFPHERVRVFNCWKNASHDRQIGDRRGRNAVECKVEGVSHNLPTGFDLLDLSVELPHQALSVSVTDRRDFYHQFKASRTRAISNTLGPGLPWELLQGTEALNLFILQNARQKSDRLQTGDLLGGTCGRFPFSKWSPGQKLFASFGSILQGGHGGVEYACDAHCNFLQLRGLLSDETRVVADRPFFGSQVMEGLVIDDYFAIAVTDRASSPSTSADVRCFETARDAYEQEKILGSAAKDVIGQRCAKVIGAQINSSEQALDKGICTVGSPAVKRYGLSWITLMVCQLAYTTDVLHVCLLGAWISVLMFRRPLMGVLNKSFKRVNASEIDSSRPKLVSLPRAVADELVLISLLVPFAITDVAAQFCDRIFCTDASLQKGAVCSADVERGLARKLWSGLRSKGAFHRLLSPTEALAKRLGISEELPEPDAPKVGRPLAFHYDFIEIFSGAAVVTAAMDKLGFVTGPPIDLSISEEFNMKWVHVIAWLSFLVASRRVKSFMVSPPCTTFSIMRRPALRSKDVPHGFAPECPLTETGNLLAHRGLQLLKIGCVNDVPGLFETPWSALLKHLPAFQQFLGKPEVECCRSDSCMFGSIHLKSFRLLAVHLQLEFLRRVCDRTHKHVVVQGMYTKQSATYVPQLAEAIARCFALGIAKLKSKIARLDDPVVRGHENQLVNSLALSSVWRVDSVWKFQKPSHINILEMSSLGKLANQLAKEGVPMRATALLDSFVCSSAAAKGRTSSVGLAPSLRRYSATCVAAALYFCTPFVPTRLNASDDPTRDVVIRSPSGSFDVSQWSDEDLLRLVCLPRLRRWSSNWVRLVLSVCGPSVLGLSDRSQFRQSFQLFNHHASSSAPASGEVLSAAPHLPAVFDSTLGYPGEGPGSLIPRAGLRLPGLLLLWFLCLSGCCPLCLLACCVSWSPQSGSGRLLSGLFAMVACVVSAEGAFVPRNTADQGRARQRASRPALLPGRPVLPATTLHRDSLFNAFSVWCGRIGVDLHHLLVHAMQNLDEINAILCRYGRELYTAGRPYGHFAETINSLTSRRPLIRRHLQPSWDLAYAWVKAEPPCHHTAMPFQVMLAICTTALLWGWARFAGVIALTWGSVMRIGETLKARRRDLLLPSDIGSTHNCALLAISEAKTRYSASRHQTAKLDIPDLLRVVILAFDKLDPECFLWPYSGSTLRLRFKSVMQAIGLPTTNTADIRPLDLGSLRAGGATWMLSISEDGEMVRRRGRWLSQRIMEIYIQETSAIRFLQSLTVAQRERVLQLADNFLGTLHLAEIFSQSSIPCASWFLLYCKQ